MGSEMCIRDSLEGVATTQEDIIDFCREQLAGYKVPKQVLLVEQVRRAPNGKADYKWAKAEAMRAFA